MSETRLEDLATISTEPELGEKLKNSE
nr:unnamed protein product [Callosobruchus chinensis]CAH7752483.1 unnamed protein product [Callosobruchus chinensis]